jgi:hypothetical protein
LPQESYEYNMSSMAVSTLRSRSMRRQTHSQSPDYGSAHPSHGRDVTHSERFTPPQDVIGYGPLSVGTRDLGVVAAVDHNGRGAGTPGRMVLLSGERSSESHAARSAGDKGVLCLSGPTAFPPTASRDLLIPMAGPKRCPRRSHSRWCGSRASVPIRWV